MKKEHRRTSDLKPISVALLSFLLGLASLQLIAETTDGNEGCLDVIEYGKNPETGEWRAFSTPCDIPDGWSSSPVRPDSCPTEVTYGLNPETREWLPFSTPCDVLSGWESATCPQAIKYGQNPDSKNWYEFSTPCDVPDGWRSSSTKPAQSECPNVITYGKNPETQHWYTFSTPCDVPQGWTISTQPLNKLLNELVAESSSKFRATYSQDGKLYIPVVDYNDLDGIVIYEGVELKLVPDFLPSLFVFMLSNEPIITKPTTTEQPVEQAE